MSSNPPGFSVGLITLFSSVFKRIVLKSIPTFRGTWRAYFCFNSPGFSSHIIASVRKQTDVDARSCCFSTQEFSKIIIWGVKRKQEFGQFCPVFLSSSWTFLQCWRNLQWGRKQSAHWTPNVSQIVWMVSLVRNMKFVGVCDSPRFPLVSSLMMPTCKNAAAPELWVKTLEWMRSVDNGLIQATRRQTSSGLAQRWNARKIVKENPTSITEEQWGSSRMTEFRLVCRMTCFASWCDLRESFHNSDLSCLKSDRSATFSPAE